MDPCSINGQRTELQDKKPIQNRYNWRTCAWAYACGLFIMNSTPFATFINWLYSFVLVGRRIYTAEILFGVLLLSLGVFHVHVCCFYVMTHKSGGGERDMKGQTIELETHNKLGMITDIVFVLQIWQCPSNGAFISLPVFTAAQRLVLGYCRSWEDVLLRFIRRFTFCIV